MKAYELAETYRQIAITDPAFEGKNLVTGQSADRPVEAYPAVVFDCTMWPIAASAEYFTYEVMITALTNPDDEDEAEHAALVELVRAKFFGAIGNFPAVRLDIKDRVQAGGKFRVLGRGHDVPQEPQTPVAQQSRFRTQLILCGSVQLL